MAHGVPKTATADDLKDIRSRVLRERWDDVRLNEGAVGALNALKNRGWTFGILSAEIPEVLDGRLDQFDIRHHFKVVRGGAWPKETAFKEVLASFPSASRRYYVDDTFDGLSSAVAMGLEPIGFTGGYNTKERILEVTDECIDSLRQLINLLN